MRRFIVLVVTMILYSAPVSATVVCGEPGSGNKALHAATFVLAAAPSFIAPVTGLSLDVGPGSGDEMLLSYSGRTDALSRSGFGVSTGVFSRETLDSECGYDSVAHMAAMFRAEFGQRWRGFVLAGPQFGYSLGPFAGESGVGLAAGGGVRHRGKIAFSAEALLLPTFGNGAPSTVRAELRVAPAWLLAPFVSFNGGVGRDPSTNEGAPFVGGMAGLAFHMER